MTVLEQFQSAAITGTPFLLAVEQYPTIQLIRDVIRETRDRATSGDREFTYCTWDRVRWEVVKTGRDDTHWRVRPVVLKNYF